MRLAAAVFLLHLARAAAAQHAPVLSDSATAALAGELSGESAKRNLEFLTRLHRMRGSQPFHAATSFVAARARDYGLAEVRIDSFPADGKIFYGTQKSRPAWDVEFAELWELGRDGTGSGEAAWRPMRRLASWDAMPITLAQDSESADLEADLVDVGDGIAERDYAGKDVRSKIVLAAQQPGPVAALAVAKHGAAGIVSYVQNQRQAWWGEDENLIRWGHLDAYAPLKTFAFMVSLKQARAFRERLARGEPIRLKATVRGGRHPGYYEVVTAGIVGADPRLREEEIAFSCHLDHQRPGANDNASGCVTILEVARSLAKLIAEGRLPRPARTLRFIWPPELEGTSALLASRPDWVRRVKAVVHMDMVGGGPVTKAVFQVQRSPASLPTFVSDLAEALGDFVNGETAAFAATGRAAFPLVSAEGGKEPLRAALLPFDLGSDHQVYTDASYGIPAISLSQWPDRYIHTNFDAAANIDPTVLQRAAFLGAAAGVILANLGPKDARELLRVVGANSLRRTGVMLERRAELVPDVFIALTRFHWQYERAVAASLERFFPVPAELKAETRTFYDRLEAALGGSLPASPLAGDGKLVFRRNPEPKGPMSVMGYDYFEDHYGPERARGVRLLSYQGLWGAGDLYVYEVLNLVDGRRSAQEIRDLVSAIYGPVPLDLVVEYLRALETIGVVRGGP